MEEPYLPHEEIDRKGSNGRRRQEGRQRATKNRAVLSRRSLNWKQLLLFLLFSHDDDIIDAPNRIVFGIRCCSTSYYPGGVGKEEHQLMSVHIVCM